MSVSVNKVIILGNLGKDPEVRESNAGSTITTIQVATSRRYKGQDGSKQEETTWHRVVLFGRQAEIARDFLRKSSEVYVEGRIHTTKWTDKTGAERYGYEIVAESMLLGSRPRTEEGASAPAPRPAPARQAAPAPAASAASAEDDIPF